MNDLLPLHAHCPCPVVYKVRFYDHKLPFSSFREETKAVLELSENRTNGNRECQVKEAHPAHFATGLSVFTAAWLLFSFLSLSSDGFWCELCSWAAVCKDLGEKFNWRLIICFAQRRRWKTSALQVFPLHTAASCGKWALKHFSVPLFHSIFHLDLLPLQMLCIFVSAYRSGQSSFSLSSHHLPLEKALSSLPSLILSLKCYLVFKNHCAGAGALIFLP